MVHPLDRTKKKNSPVPDALGQLIIFFLLLILLLLFLLQIYISNIALRILVE
jgi:hypothetical protein